MKDENSGSMPMVIPTKWEFRGIMKDGQWYSLDGKTKITNRNYCKYTITDSIEGLTEEEQNDIKKRRLDNMGLYF